MRISDWSSDVCSSDLLTEAAGTVSTSRLDDSFDQRTGRCGVPLDEWEVRIVDVATGRECGVDERGEIVLRGPNMLQGYTSEEARGGKGSVSTYRSGGSTYN